MGEAAVATALRRNVRNGRLGLVLVGWLLAGAAAAAQTFTSSWKAPEASSVSFKGKKVAALVISTDENLRMSVEEQLAHELEARGVRGIAAYRLIPAEELTTSAQARPWLERAGIEGVVSLRPVSVDTKLTYSPVVWQSAPYATMWGYYDTGWIDVYTPSNLREETTLVVETLIHSVPLDTLLWAGVSTTTNPRKAPDFIKELVDATVEEMRRQHVIE
jgi:hypothetical protein